MEYRIEKDTMGEVKVPSHVYWGAQTQRSIENFKIAQDINRMPKEIIRAFAYLKKAAADMVKNNVPNYAFVSDFIKGLRQLPVGNFVAFPAEIIRTSSNIVETALKEINYTAAHAIVVSEDWDFYNHSGYDLGQVKEAVTDSVNGKKLGLNRILVSVPYISFAK